MTEYNPGFRFYYNNPLYNKFKNYKTLGKIIAELNKLGLPYPKDVAIRIEEQTSKLRVASTLSLLGLSIFVAKVKAITLINKLTFSGIFYTGIFFYYNQLCHEKTVEILLFSDSIVGQETRIITKWFFPDHSKSMIIDELISQFKVKTRMSKQEISQKKIAIQSMVEKELEEDDLFVKRLKEKMDKEF